MNIEFLPVIANDVKQTEFLLELMNEAKSTMWDDRKKDNIVIIDEIFSLANPEYPTQFIVVVDGVWSGFIGAIIDVFDVAYIDGACLRKNQRFYPAKNTIIKFSKYLFNELKVHKIKIKVPMLTGSKATPSEAVTRASGFRKSGLARKEFKKKGRFYDVLEFELFPYYLKEA